MFCKIQDSECRLTAVVNIIYVEEVEEPTREFLSEGSPGSMGYLGSLNFWLERKYAALRRRLQLMKTFSLVQVQIPIHLEDDNLLQDQKEGKYILQLMSIDNCSETISHTVFVDVER